MTEESQFVVEAMEALYSLQNGRSNRLSPFLFQKAFENLGPGHPQICGPLKRGLVSQDDIHVRLCVLDLVSGTGRGWADQFGAQFADEVVLSIADSNLLCAANACCAVQSWNPGGNVSTQLLLWAKKQLPGLWEPSKVEPGQIPSVPKMIKELPSYAAYIQQRRDLNNSEPSLENSMRLFGKLKGIMLSAFKKS